MRLQLKEVQPQALVSAPVAKKLTRTPEMIAEELLIKWEGFREKAYQDSVGIWTVGYGTTRIDGRPVTADDRVTPEQALKYKRADMQWAVAAVKDIEAQAPRPLEPHEEGALISWTYNIGADAAKGSRAVTGRLKAGDFEGAADGLLKWNKGGQPLRVIAGLTNRREDERAVFLGRDLPPQFEEPTAESSEANVGAEPTPVEDVKPVRKSSRFWAMLVSLVMTSFLAMQDFFLALFFASAQTLENNPEVISRLAPGGVAIGIIVVGALLWAIYDHMKQYGQGKA